MNFRNSSEKGLNKAEFLQTQLHLNRILQKNIFILDHFLYSQICHLLLDTQRSSQRAAWEFSLP